jgi:hypothetical protein
MTPIDLRVSRSKVTRALNVRMVSAENLENYSSQILYISHIGWS